jgi:Rieske Fe-S protein
MNDDLPKRRRFLHVVAGSGAAVVVAACGSSSTSSTPFAAGNVKDVSIGSLKAVSGESVAIGRDAKGVYALTTICPHASCDMAHQGTVSASGFSCSCHGSTFSANGDVRTGPARDALEHYHVEIDAAGAITVHPETVVDATERTAVPG